MIETEPKLQSLEGETFTKKQPLLKMTLNLTSRQMDTGEADSAELFSMKIFFNPHAKSCPKTISGAYKYHEKVETLKYKQRILDVEHSSFVPILFARTGGAAPGSTKTFQKLAEKLNKKRNESYSDTINNLHFCGLQFSTLGGAKTLKYIQHRQFYLSCN